MNITKDVITDLYPLYVENECSADTQALVKEYLQRNPQHAEELRRVMSAPLPGAVPPAKNLDEVQSLREARRRVRRRSWLMALAIFFSLMPFSFISTGGHTWWMLRDAPNSALVYAALGVVFWIIYAVERKRSNSL
jgi:ferric-dicitrate binding protein FerR (iron transport regulator)